MFHKINHRILRRVIVNKKNNYLHKQMIFMNFPQKQKPTRIKFAVFYNQDGTFFTKLLSQY
jgi:hypothetical protein